MPWETSSLEDLRALNRDQVAASLGTTALVPNSPGRVLADASAGLAYTVLLYIAWLANQFLPDTAETEWLDRHGDIWVGGRKQATYAAGTILATGSVGAVIPSGTPLAAATALGTVLLQTTTEVILGSGSTSVPVTAVTPGAVANLEAGTGLAFGIGISGLNGQATIGAMAGGTDAETDDELRVRVLDRIRKPPMGGDADDYVAWALECPGVTRAWCSPLEMGMGTVTIRVMLDDLRATPLVPTTDGFPTTDDITAVQAAIDEVRPVAVKDFFVVAPVPEPINFTIANLSPDTSTIRANLAASVKAMLKERAAPAYALNGVGQAAQTIYASWVSEAISAAEGVDHFDLTFSDHAMPTPGSMAVLGTITYA